jgi:altronate hydrolase
MAKPAGGGMENNVILIHPGDNVAVAVRPIQAGEPVVGGGVEAIVAVGDIPQYHKVSLAALRPGAPVIKYGEAIAMAKAPITAGEWVHTHNLEDRAGG